MEKVLLTNTALFISMACVHAMRLAYQVPVLAGKVTIPFWISFFAILALVTLAWFNWEAIHKRGKREVIHLLMILLVIDIVGGLLAQTEGLTLWGLHGIDFTWIMLFDLGLIAVLYHWEHKKR